MIATFFGHRYAPQKIEPALCEALSDLIKNKNVDLFYVGNHGGFDRAVRRCLKALKLRYPHIKYYVVAYVTDITGNAAHFKQVAEKKGKTVINLNIG